jgi:hypothetical protein
MAERDWSTVSPSAKWLLLLKAQTSIPFAREAAVLLFGETVVAASRAGKTCSPTGTRPIGCSSGAA